MGLYMDTEAGAHRKSHDVSSIGYGFLHASSDLQYRQKSSSCTCKISYILLTI